MNSLKKIIPLFFLLVLTASLEAGIWDTVTGYLSGKEEKEVLKVPVLIVHDKPGALVEVKGKYHLLDPRTNDLISTRFVGKQKFMQPLHSGLKWGEEFPGQYQILISPDNASITTLVDGIEYQGELYIYDIGGTISIVNTVPLEEYVKAVLSDVPGNLPQEELAAFAIVARTNAYYSILHPKTPFWAVDASKVGYNGSSSKYPQEGLLKAISLTQGMVMTQEPNLPSGVFLADFGGLPMTATVKDTIVSSKIKKDDIEEIAKQGGNAAKILLEAFPSASITLIR